MPRPYMVFIQLTDCANNTLGDTVWVDLDHDGIQDAGELGIAGIRVCLYDANGQLFDSAVTASDGARYFDQVHADFLKRLRQKHPNLTLREEKLCAYLRMNLSSKDLASLMSISVRGVEISRYRLPKKLSIPSGMGLPEFLQEI